MAWLLRDGSVLAAVEERRPHWQATLKGAMVVRGPCVVQTLAEPVPLDVAWCTRVVLDGATPALRVRRIAGTGARRSARLQPRRGALLVAPAGAFDRWALHVGDVLEVRDG